ncbi:MAG: Gfo/Idh/MocA family oxidoreductase [Verrucomicrobia bacterium]|nr:Gfo/Idh/MocA family oxidoreductase [Verrucomicrobiota bacterium]
MNRYRLFHWVGPAACAAALAISLSCSAAGGANRPLRIGIIGLDTSHVVAFTKLFNDPKATGDLADMRVTAAYPGGSPDIEASRSRVKGYTAALHDKFGVEIVDSIPELLAKVDVVLLESVDGRPHLNQAKPVFAARKPVFIDKPAAGSLADVIEIFERAKRTRTPCFSSSSLRFNPPFQQLLHDPKIGRIIGCDAYSPCSIEPHHPDLFWYGVHGVESLYTMMGPGCAQVTRAHTEGTDFVTGVWRDGRIGTFRGLRQGPHRYGLTVFGEKGIATVDRFQGYAPLVRQIARFFKTGVPPVKAEETIEIFAFMEAADASKRLGGRPVSVPETLAKARVLVEERLRRAASGREQ